MMRSSNFGAIVSPRGASVAPRMFTSLQSSSTRSPRGGLATLTPQMPASAHPYLPPSPHVPHMPAPRFKGGGKTKAKIKKVMDEWKQGKLHSGSKKGPVVHDQKQAVAIALSQARQKLAQGGAVLPRSKKTVDMVENGRVVVRHQFYGKDAREARHMLNSHKKADKSFADALAGKKYKGIDIKAVRRTRGGRIGYDDGGSIPSYDEYLASSAAPQGMTPEQYQQDYADYAHDLQGADQPYVGNWHQYLGQGDKLKNIVLSGGLNDKGRAAVDAWKGRNDNRFLASLAGAAWGLSPLALPARVSTTLFGLQLAKGAGLVPEGTPDYETYFDLPKELGLPLAKDPAFDPAVGASGLTSIGVSLPSIVRETKERGAGALKDIAKAIRGYKRPQAAKP